MPTRKVSSCFFFLMSSEFSSGRGNGWESADTLSTFGIDYAPSTDEADPLPTGLNNWGAARLIGELINAARSKDPADRMAFIDADPDDSSWSVHRAMWRKWYKILTPKVNQAIDKVLSELESLPKMMLYQQDDDAFPELTNLIAMTNSASKALFGDYACNGAFLKKDAQPAFKMLLAQTHARHKRNWKRALTTLFGKVNPQGVALAEGVGLWPALEKHMKSKLGYILHSFD
jgi:hypothetical protein